MKKLLFPLLSLLFLLCSCSSNVNKSNYNKININDSLEDVVKLLGEANEYKIMFPEPFMNTYIWLNQDLSLEEAKNSSSKVYYIEVVINNKNKVIGKKSGIITKDFELGDVNLYA